jgi:transposase
MVYLNQHQMLPVARTAQLMRDTCGLAVSQAAVIKAAVAASVKLAPVVQAIAGAIKTAPVVHADETGMRVNKALHWMHTAVTASLTFIARHTKRGKRGQEAFETIGILPAYRGTLIHDGWMPYHALACVHGLCNAHHLRELVYVHEQMHQAWAKDAFDLLLQAHEQVQSTGKPLAHHQIDHLQLVFEQVLQQGDLANLRQSATGKRGRTKQSKALNLIDRLRLHGDDVWRFATDVGVPFTNNLAEQAVRKPQGQAKNLRLLSN